MTEFRPDLIFSTLAAERVRYVGVGAIALIAHGVVRATRDADIVPDPAPANLARLATAITALGGRPRGEPETSVTAELLGRDANMRFDTDAGQLDVLCSEAYRHRYPDLDSRAVDTEAEGVPIRVVSRNDLILLKAATGRDRDLLDIGDLLALEE